MVGFSRQHLSLICDVGSGSVGAGLFLFSPDTKPLFLGSVRVPLKIPSEFAPLQEKQILALVSHACKELLTLRASWSLPPALQRKKVDSLEIFLASPWHIARTSTAEFEKETTFMVDKEMLDRILSSEGETFQAELSAQKALRSTGSSIRIIERSLTDIRLNGYPTTLPLGKKANQVECALYMSAVSESLFSGFEDIAHRVVHSDSMTLRSFPLAYFRTINRTFLHEKQCLLFDCAGESTDVCFIHQGMLESAASIPVGKNTLIRSIMERCDVTSEIALSFLHTFQNGAVHPTFGDKLELSIKEYHTLWEEAVRKMVPSSRVKQSSEYFIVCDEDFSEIAKTCVQNLAQKPSSRLFLLAKEEFAPHLEYAKHSIPDPFLSLEALSFRPPVS